MINLKEKLLAGWLGDKLLTNSRVVSVEDVGQAYRCLTVESPSLRQTKVSAGDKVQVFLPGVGTRTYTPFAQQSDLGRVQLLVFLPGKGPASAWARSLQSGDELRFVGPQTSLPFASMSAPLVLFGDETSLAAARTLIDAHGSRASAVLEVDDLDSARLACARIGLADSTLIRRSPASTFYQDVARRLLEGAGPDGTIAMSGSAQTIQRVRGELRKLDSKTTQKVKAYWSQGRTGLD